MEQIRILHVLGGLYLAGAESRIMDQYRSLNRDEVQFDFCVHTKKEEFYEKEVLAMGGRIFRIPQFKIYNYFSYRKAWKQFFEEHREFTAVHGHMTSTASIYLPIAKKAGIPLTIAHARSAGVDGGLKRIATKFFRRNLAKKADHLFTCSHEAGVAVFGTKAVEEGSVLTVPNAIQTRSFIPNEEIRNKMRAEWKLTDKVVYGHVGNFRYAKNHPFLLEIFAEIIKKQQNAELVLVGDGELRDEITEKIDSLGLQEKVILTGRQSNVGDFMQMMDVLLFPSHFEGLPGTILEAQVNGLPVLLSDSVTKEVAISDLVVCKSLSESAQDWADKAILLSKQPKESRIKEVRIAGFDVDEQNENMVYFYRNGKWKA